MTRSADVVGTHAGALQSRVCVQYAPTVARFRKRDLDRHGRHLSTIDASSEYTLIAPMGDNGPVGCHNAFAVFTLLEQKPVKKRQGLMQSYSVLVSVKCEYVNTQNELCTYLFQAVADHDVCNDGYFHHMQVNQNGTLLLLVAASAAYVVRVPGEMDENSVVADVTTRTLLYSSILRAEVILDKRSARRRQRRRKLVKVGFHEQYTNTICMLTMEARESHSGGTEEADEGHEGADPADSVGGSSRLSCQGQDSFEGRIQPSRHRSLFEVEMRGMVRIFNVDQSIDTPFMAMELTEGMCRTGDRNARHNADATPQGAVVDFCWNSQGKFTWGSTTLFVLTNYGLVFAYCPVLLPGCVKSFKKKCGVVRLADELMQEGYRIKTAPRMDSLSAPEDVTLLMESLAGGQRVEAGDSAPVEVVPSVYKLEANEDTGRDRFEAMAMMRTEPVLQVVVAAVNGTLVLYQGYSPLRPQTSHFYRPGADIGVQYLQYVGINRARGNQGGVRTGLLRISEVTCIAHSAVETSVVLLDGRVITIKSLAHVRATGDHVYYHSQPLVLTGRGEKNSHYAFKDLWSDPRNKMYLVQAVYCYLQSQDELRHLGAAVSPMPFREEPSVEVEKLSGALTNRLAIPGISANMKSVAASFSTGGGNAAVQKGIQKLRQYARDSEAQSGDAFRAARALVSKDVDFKTKAVEIVKTVSSIDSKVMLYLKARKHFEVAVAESVAAFSGVHAEVAAMLETLPEYGERLEDLLARSERVRARSADIVERQQRISGLQEELRRLRSAEAAGQQVSDLITSVYLRCSQKMSRSISCRVGQSDELYNYKECVKRVVDQWLAETLKANVETMEKTFARIQGLRSRLVELN